MEESGFVARPDYRVDIHRRRNRVTVRRQGEVLAETTGSLLVDEQDHGLVFYLPRDDVRLDLLEPVDHRTRCPYKGWASHWKHPDGEQPIAWSYEDPYPEVARIRGYVAFYQDRVSVEIGEAPYLGPR